MKYEEPLLVKPSPNPQPHNPKADQSIAKSFAKTTDFIKIVQTVFFEITLKFISIFSSPFVDVRTRPRHGFVQFSGQVGRFGSIRIRFFAFKIVGRNVDEQGFYRLVDGEKGFFRATLKSQGVIAFMEF